MVLAGWPRMLLMWWLLLPFQLRGWNLTPCMNGCLHCLNPIDNSVVSVGAIRICWKSISERNLLSSETSSGISRDICQSLWAESDAQDCAGGHVAEPEHINSSFILQSMYNQSTICSSPQKYLKEFLVSVSKTEEVYSFLYSLFMPPLSWLDRQLKATQGNSRQLSWVNQVNVSVGFHVEISIWKWKIFIFHCFQ